ncbi:MAG: glycosyltransferase family 4 protein [Nitrospiraceae bacterium]|nr:glycosyltransferase family 4 protein [Nitrospiraceae bacterium]
MRTFSISMVAACPFPANHGSPASIREMSQALSSLGHRIHVVTYAMGQDIPVDGITIHRVGSILQGKRISVGPTYYKPFLDFLLVAKLCRVIRQEKIDIIHAHNYEGALAGYIAKKITRTPMLYNAVNNMISELPQYNFIRPKKLAVKIAGFLDNAVPKMGDHVTVVSEELEKFVLRKGIPRERISIIPAGVNIEMFEGKNPEVMRERHRIGSRPLVVYTGTLDLFQGIEHLIKAMRTVIEDIRDAVLLLVGNIINPADLARHKQLAAALGIADHVIFTDERPLEEIPYFLASADVAAVPRTSCPGFPVKLLNYMAAGKAIVAFEGSSKGLENNLNAMVVKGSDSGAFGRSISLLLRDPALRKKLGTNAKAAVKGNFDWRSLAKKIEAIYKKIVPDNKAGGTK